MSSLKGGSLGVPIRKMTISHSGQELSGLPSCRSYAGILGSVNCTNCSSSSHGQEGGFRISSFCWAKTATSHGRPMSCHMGMSGQVDIPSKSWTGLWMSYGTCHLVPTVYDMWSSGQPKKNKMLLNSSIERKFFGRVMQWHPQSMPLHNGTARRTGGKLSISKGWQTVK